MLSTKSRLQLCKVGAKIGQEYDRTPFRTCFPESAPGFAFLMQ